MVRVLLAQISWVWVCVRVTISWIFCSDPLCDYISLGGRGHERCGLRPSYNNDSESQPIHDLWLLVAQILLSFPPTEEVFIVNTSTILCAPCTSSTGIQLVNGFQSMVWKWAMVFSLIFKSVSKHQKVYERLSEEKFIFDSGGYLQYWWSWIQRWLMSSCQKSSPSFNSLSRNFCLNYKQIV